ncbi:hypothetical protein FRC17_003122 [Serendipita sp. 399]|nr:hypothetical protein FRC17_003122 [Serendipita sp. 399]
MSSTDVVPNSIDEDRMYGSEKQDNFRWIAKWLATTSSYVLKDNRDRVDPQVEDAVSTLAEFAEIAHGSIDPVWILDPLNRKILGRDGFPLAGYKALAGLRDGELIEDIKMVERFKGNVGDLQGYTALRMNPQTAARPCGTNSDTPKPQVILAFSGTSNITLGLYNLMTMPARYQPLSGNKSNSNWKVHDGFQRVYQSIRDAAIQALNQAIEQIKEAYDGEWDLVITGHSLGTAVLTFFLLDLMHCEELQNKASAPPALKMPQIPLSTNVTLAKFGPPRVVNSSLADEYREQMEQFRRRRGRDEALTDWAVIGHMDGVPAVPPTRFGYVHLCLRPFYLYHGKMYSIPQEEREHSLFLVEETTAQGAAARPPLYPKGGHNYYGARDMERLQRRMQAIRVDVEGTNSNLDRPAQPTTVKNPGSTQGTKKKSNDRGLQPRLDDPPWVRLYLEREREEEQAWVAKASGGSRWAFPIVYLLM